MDPQVHALERLDLAEGLPLANRLQHHLAVVRRAGANDGSRDLIARSDDGKLRARATPLHVEPTLEQLEPLVEDRDKENVEDAHAEQRPEHLKVLRVQPLPDEQDLGERDRRDERGQLDDRHELHFPSAGSATPKACGITMFRCTPPHGMPSARPASPCPPATAERHPRLISEMGRRNGKGGRPPNLGGRTRNGLPEDLMARSLAVGHAGSLLSCDRKDDALAPRDRAPHRETMSWHETGGNLFGSCGHYGA
ncbi:hypothetical protein SPF06_04830 [Sinomonas sp. JGH33]|uniref:Uncharacterized protein n=1 Tax=Sinomonas terricola TaxID=3110330 RepID=A0ABU5T300_9MICC|nr:hypothetical protein [Sinomonas sp. JGH33]MEA5454042.1 hypothetical protein [Sinomonas sp. JGH33]